MFHVEHFAATAGAGAPSPGIKNSSAPVSLISDPTSAAIHPPSRTRAAASSMDAFIFSTARMVTASNRRSPGMSSTRRGQTSAAQSQRSDYFVKKRHLLGLGLGDRHSKLWQQHLDWQTWKSGSTAVIQQL